MPGGKGRSGRRRDHKHVRYDKHGTEERTEKDLPVPLTIMGFVSRQSIQRFSPLPRTEAGLPPEYRRHFHIELALATFGCAENIVLGKLLRAVL